ncbi:MAG: hypothetical protein ACI9SC_002742 [Gammaproteobacteria bacterium]|jgi:hypothetical protein
MDFITWIENSAVGMWMVDSLWAYPIILSTHAVGMSIVVGTLIVIDLRILGYAGEAAIESFAKLFFVTWVGVVLNFLSGLALFTSDPGKFFYHPVFWTKIGLMMTGVFSAYLLWRQIKKNTGDTNAHFQASIRVKMLACFSLLLWIGVIVAGRLIGYVELS